MKDLLAAVRAAQELADVARRFQESGVSRALANSSRLYSPEIATLADVARQYQSQMALAAKHLQEGNIPALAAAQQIAGIGRRLQESGVSRALADASPLYSSDIARLAEVARQYQSQMALAAKGSKNGVSLRLRRRKR